MTTPSAAGLAAGFAALGEVTAPWVLLTEGAQSHPAFAALPAPNPQAHLH